MGNMKNPPILWLASLLALSILIVGIVSNATLNRESPTFNKEVPTLKVGDKWVVEYTNTGSVWPKLDSFTYTMEITGEDTIDGKDCYVMEYSYNPSTVNAWEDFESIFYISKTTYDDYRIQLMGTINSVPISSVITYSYDYPEEPYWPLEVGKEVKQVKTETTTQTYMYTGETEMYPATKTTTIFKIEKVEEITVEAGTFNCFKIVEYDACGDERNTDWYSDTVKQNVKVIDYVFGYTGELKSYSVY